jgi:predicted GNAT family N-acyltransferase
MRIDVVREPDVPAALDAAIMRLEQRAFPKTVQFATSRHYIHVARPGDFRVLAWLDDMLVGQVTITWAIAKSAAGTWRLAEVGNVCSDPDHRKEHAPSACMERAMEQARQDGGDGALLFCGASLEKFYARFGFGVVPNEILLTHIDGTVFRRDHRDLRMGLMLTDQTWPQGELHLDTEDF